LNIVANILLSRADIQDTENYTQDVAVQCDDFHEALPVNLAVNKKKLWGVSSKIPFNIRFLFIKKIHLLSGTPAASINCPVIAPI
jgi:hypothetical protein